MLPSVATVLLPSVATECYPLLQLLGNTTVATAVTQQLQLLGTQLLPSVACCYPLLQLLGTQLLQLLLPLCCNCWVTALLQLLLPTVACCYPVLPAVTHWLPSVATAVTQLLQLLGTQQATAWCYPQATACWLQQATVACCYQQATVACCYSTVATAVTLCCNCCYPLLQQRLLQQATVACCYTTVVTAGYPLLQLLGTHCCLLLPTE